MKLVADLHSHTNASTHALSTMQEMITAAQKLGLNALALTDHGPNVPDAPVMWHFNTLMDQVPHWLDGFLVLRGVEANVIDKNGGLDIELPLLQALDWVVASIHGSGLGHSSLTQDEATALWLCVADNPHVDMIGHSEEQQYRYDYDAVTKVFAQKGKVVELNANSANARPGNEANLKELALSCKRNGTWIAVNSDSHAAFTVGNQGDIPAMLQDIDFPRELIVNSSMDTLLQVLRQHGRIIPPNPASNL